MEKMESGGAREGNLLEGRAYGEVWDNWKVETRQATDSGTLRTRTLRKGKKERERERKETKKAKGQKEEKLENEELLVVRGCPIQDRRRQF